ncbi:MAG: hypothetical protein KJO07_21115, partial [Deltaproteobacteria bacterium]|nr:hypothetical protein [Deltaproteobacteria bacterium]
MSQSLAIALLAVLVSAVGCEKKRDPGKDMKPATSWTAPAPMASKVGGSDPHAGAARAGDPHAGMNMGGDPH